MSTNLSAEKNFQFWKEEKACTFTMLCFTRTCTFTKNMHFYNAVFHQNMHFYKEHALLQCCVSPRIAVKILWLSSWYFSDLYGQNLDVKNPSLNTINEGLIICWLFLLLSSKTLRKVANGYESSRDVGCIEYLCIAITTRLTLTWKWKYQLIKYA